MYRPALRVASRARPTPTAQQIGRRFASTGPSRSGTFKGTLARWGLAGAIVYYYNTSTVFADEPRFATFAPPETQSESEQLATIDAIAEQRKAQSRPRSDAPQPQATSNPLSTPDAEPAVIGGPGELEEEAQQQGAFNEETGEINWDCPCLGGMAYGVCGEQFRAAFSCFVYSKEDPKGVDCIEHFKAMQNCFREHPDIYGAELDDEELQVDGDEQQGAPAAAAQSAEVDAPAATSQAVEPTKAAPSSPSA